MSYCVNCGVELDPSEKACPLCGVEVLNPRQPYDEKIVRPYPSRLDPINARINRQFIATILSICFAFPAVLCVVINMILDSSANWSLYAAGGLGLAWICVVPYYLYARPTFAKLVLPDTLGLLLYLYLIARMQPHEDWYLTLGLPLILLVCGLVFLNGLLISRHLIRGFVIPAAILCSVGALTMGIELITEMHLSHAVHLDWSLFVSIPCLALALICLSVARRQSIREEIRKRLHL